MTKREGRYNCKITQYGTTTFKGVERVPDYLDSVSTFPFGDIIELIRSKHGESMYPTEKADFTQENFLLDHVEVNYETGEIMFHHKRRGSCSWRTPEVKWEREDADDSQ